MNRAWHALSVPYFAAWHALGMPYFAAWLGREPPARIISLHQIDGQGHRYLKMPGGMVLTGRL